MPQPKHRFFFPETKQRTLENINAVIGENVAVHYYGATVKEQEEYSKAIESEDLGFVRKGEACWIAAMRRRRQMCKVANTSEQE